MKLLTLALFLFISSSLHAQDSRWIDLEWEAVPGARGYEIELFQEVENKNLPRGKYKTDEAAWSHAVSPGKYSLRLRSVDSRGVPGEWSPEIPLKVRMQNPVLLRPVKGDRLSDPLVIFEWGPVKGAGKYQLIIMNSEKVLHNSVTREERASIYLDELGDLRWTVLALEENEAPRSPEEISAASFRVVKRVGGLLTAPVVGITIQDKIQFFWKSVRGAKLYEVDYFPPPGSGERNRRFNLKLSPLKFPRERLKDGVTTLTIRARSPGYQDSAKSIVKISKRGTKVEIEDIIQGADEKDVKSAPTQAFFRNEIYGGVSLSRFTYESENIETDTRFDQESLTGLGGSVEWHHRPTLNSLLRKTEFQLTNLSSGIDSGLAARLAYSWNKESRWNGRTVSYGGGASYLQLPAFMGDRFEDKIKVESTGSIGPEFHLGVINPLSNVWELQAHLVLSYQAFSLMTDNEGMKGFLWYKGVLRAMRYYTDKQAFYGQLDYQSWSQEFNEDSSGLSGIGMNFGIKSAF